MTMSRLILGRRRQVCRTTSVCTMGSCASKEKATVKVAVPQPCPVKAAHEAMYPGVGMCPYATFFGKKAGDAGKVDTEWVQKAMEAYEKNWRADGCPVGNVKMNDHNYTTLGKGPTCGVLAASLAIGTSADDGEDVLGDLPAWARVGLFAEKKSYPAVMRVSTLGKDGEESRYRFGLKVPYGEHVEEEVNFTTTDSTDYFPIPGYGQIETMVTDPSDRSFLNTFGERVVGLSAALRSLPKGGSKGKNFFDKIHYGQLPYRLGDERAFKYRFRCVTPILNNDDANEKHQIRNHLRAVLEKMPVSFALEIQVHHDINSADVQSKGNRAWSLPWCEVGVLTLPRQELDEDGFAVPLREALGEGKSEAEKAALGETINFHPNMMPDVHYPVGELQHFRSAYYAVHAKHRFDLHLKDVGAVPHIVNFAQLRSNEACNKLLSAAPVTYLDGDPDEMPEQWKRMNRHTRLLTKAAVPKLAEALLHPQKDDMLNSLTVLKADEKMYEGGVQVLNVTDKLRIELLKDDEVYGEVPFVVVTMMKAFRQPWLGFPLEDIVEFVTDEEMAKIELITGLSMCLPLPHRVHPEPNSDAAVAACVFQGRGLQLVSLDDATGGYVLDMMHLKDLGVRPGFENYGVKAYFTDDGAAGTLSKIDKIQNGQVVTIAPGDERWEAAKFLFKCSLGMYTTGVYHLLGVHFLVANVMCNARAKLPVAHPIHRFLAVHMFRTVFVNNQAKDSLIPERSFFHRGSALDYESGVKPLLEQGVAVIDFWKPFPDWVADSPVVQKMKKDGVTAGEPGFRVDGELLYATHHKYVSEWVAKFFPSDDELAADGKLKEFWAVLVAGTAAQKYALPDEMTRAALVNALAQYVFVVTGYHELYGTIREYVSTPASSCLRAAEGAARADLQCFVMGEMILAATSLKTPMLMGCDWPGHFTAEERPVWEAYQTALKTTAAQVASNNEKRDMKYPSFDPAVLEVAVSV